MKLRSKITVLLGSTFLILLIVVYAASYVLSLSGFSKIETSDIKQDVGQVTDSISDNETNLSLKANDWSAWDDAYQFAQDGNQDFIDANLAYASIQDLNINFMIFINKQGALVKSVGLDYNDPNVGSANYQGISIPTDLQPYLSLGSPVLNLPNLDSSKVGIISLSEGPLIFASRPITRSDGTGPIEGTLVFGRYLYWTKPDGKVDNSQVDNISNLTHFAVTAFGVNSGTLPPDASSAISQISGQNQVATKVLSSKTIAGYAQLNDVYGKPAVLFRVESPRTIYAQGLASLNYFIIALLGIGVIFGIATLILLDRTVLSRVSRLNDALATVAVNHDYSTRLPADGHDHLTQLALSTNLLLDELQLYPQIRETVEKMRGTFYGSNQASAAQPMPQPAQPVVAPQPQAAMPQVPPQPEPAPIPPPATPPVQPPVQPPVMPPPPQPTPPVEVPPPQPPAVPPHDPHDMFDPRNTSPHLNGLSSDPAPTAPPVPPVQPPVQPPVMPPPAPPVPPQQPPEPPQAPPPPQL
jgi:sensor domain CHASE-containing protein